MFYPRPPFFNGQVVLWVDERDGDLQASRSAGLEEQGMQEGKKYQGFQDDYHDARKRPRRVVETGRESLAIGI